MKGFKHSWVNSAFLFGLVLDKFFPHSGKGVPQLSRFKWSFCFKVLRKKGILSSRANFDSEQVDCHFSPNKFYLGSAGNCSSGMCKSLPCMERRKCL